MAGYFLDTSAIVKRYVREAGTTWVRDLTRRGLPDQFYLSRIATVELTSAIARRRRGRSLSAARAGSIVTRFGRHTSGRFLLVEVNPSVLTLAARLTDLHALRAYDAVQLATAIDIIRRWQAGGRVGITLITADQELLAAAAVERLMTDDPNLHP